jgi:CxxC motif-containing protein
MKKKYKFKCKSCGNRCKLKIVVKDGHVESVKGNKCGKGVQFADKKLTKKDILKD